MESGRKRLATVLCYCMHHFPAKYASYLYSSSHTFIVQKGLSQTATNFRLKHLFACNQIICTRRSQILAYLKSSLKFVDPENNVGQPYHLVPCVTPDLTFQLHKSVFTRFVQTKKCQKTCICTLADIVLQFSTFNLAEICTSSAPQNEVLLKAKSWISTEQVQLSLVADGVEISTSLVQSFEGLPFSLTARMQLPVLDNVFLLRTVGYCSMTESSTFVRKVV